MTGLPWKFLWDDSQAKNLKDEKRDQNIGRMILAEAEISAKHS